MSQDLEMQRKVRLHQERAKLESLVAQLDDPTINHDVSENTVRDDLLEKVKAQEALVRNLEASTAIVHIPGTWNLGDKLLVKYLRIVSYGKDRELPKEKVKIELVDSYDITELGNVTNINDVDLVPTPINSPLGRALLHKAHNVIRFNTGVGYCEVEVERCAI